MRDGRVGTSMPFCLRVVHYITQGILRDVRTNISVEGGVENITSIILDVICEYPFMWENISVLHPHPKIMSDSFEGSVAESALPSRKKF